MLFNIVHAYLYILHIIHWIAISAPHSTGSACKRRFRRLLWASLFSVSRFYRIFWLMIQFILVNWSAGKKIKKLKFSLLLSYIYIYIYIYIHTVSQKNWDPYTHINNYVIFCFNGISFLPHQLWLIPHKRCNFQQNSSYCLWDTDV